MVKENSKLKAVVKIRNLVSSTVDDWNKIKLLGREVDLLTNEAIAIIAKIADENLAHKWSEKIHSYNDNVSALKDIMKQAIDKIENRNASDANQIWESSTNHSNSIVAIVTDMETSGLDVIPENLKLKWSNIWAEAKEKLQQIRSLAVGSELKLAMIESFTPEEVSELTDEILIHMPMDYSVEEAEKYEKEYLVAYDEIKAKASLKKNLWDRFLDLLAGGTQQSAAEKVIMQRWVNGEKGKL